MANLCITSVIVKSDNKEILNKINDAFNSAASYHEALMKLGVSRESISDYKDSTINLSYIDVDGALHINLETEWYFEYESLNLLNSMFTEKPAVLFLSEEMGCEVYETNDFNKEFFKEKYYLDINEGAYYIESDSDLIDMVNECFNERFLNVSDVFEFVNGAPHTYVREIDYVDFD